MRTFNTRSELIDAIVSEFKDEKAASFNYNPTAVRFWTFNRLLRYYFKRKDGRKFGPKSLLY